MTQETLANSILADEASTGSIIVGSGVASTLLIFFQSTIKRMLPLMFIALVVIVLDLIMGIRAARKRGEDIRISRAIRRTLGKIVEYFCWCVLASSLAVALDFPLIEKIIVLVVIGIEGISIGQNWYFAKFGKKVKVDVAKIGGAVLQSKTGVDIGDAIKVDENNDKNESETL